jgi:hypothetical protein
LDGILLETTLKCQKSFRLDKQRAGRLDAGEEKVEERQD